jgi:hypothetical protein
VIPEGSAKYNDLIDIVITSSQKTVDVMQKDGSITKEKDLDDDTLWWKTLSVHSDTLGRYAYELMEWIRTAYTTKNNMSEERANQYSLEILEYATSHRRSIDAKSSESKRDKQNSQSTLLDKINHKTSEKIYTQKGEVKKGLFDAFLGREKERDEVES